MGIYYKLYTLLDSQAQDLLNDPEIIHIFLDVRDADPGGQTSLSLDKYWHGMHFALTSTAWEGEKPLNFLMAGETVGNIDVGYGNAQILFSEDVLQIDKGLAEFTEQDLDRNFDLRAMKEAGIYPQIWDEPRKELLAEYQSLLQELKRFIHYAAENKQAIVIAVQ
jgi:Domain of unknown function (DUF1877)